MMTANWSLQRAEFGEQPFLMLVALAAMLGQIGRPGLGFSFGHGSMGGMGSPRTELPSVSLPLPANPADSFIPVARITDMLEKPGVEYNYNGRRLRYPDARMIYWAGGNPFHHHQDLNRLQRAWARAETIVVHEPWWTPAARHADIVLPATTTLERDDIGSSSRDRFVVAMKRAIPPQGQARDDFAILADVADHLGVRDRFTEQRDVSAWLRAMYETWRQNIARRGFDVPDFDAFWQAGYVELPQPQEPVPPFASFRDDPDRHPLQTPSGRIELFSAAIDGFGYADCPGHPVWLAPREYLGSAVAAHYPIHLLSPQPATRLHGQLDQGRVSQAGKIRQREVVTMNTDDARRRNLAAGMMVRIFNDRGACLAGLRVSDDIVPGVAVLPTGAWFDPLSPGVPGSMCVHGNANMLTRDVGTSQLGQGPAPQSCLVEIELWPHDLPPIKVDQPPDIETA